MLHHHPLPRRQRGHDIFQFLSRPAQADLLASLHVAQRYRSVEARAACPARLMPWWRKVSATNKFRLPKPRESSPNSYNVSDKEGSESEAICARRYAAVQYSSGGLTICAQMVWDCSALVC